MTIILNEDAPVEGGEEPAVFPAGCCACVVMTKQTAREREENIVEQVLI